jgi:4-aminobutyrate aminotransferase-like enzyme
VRGRGLMIGVEIVDERKPAIIWVLYLQMVNWQQRFKRHALTTIIVRKRRS